MSDYISREKAIIQLSHNKNGNDDSDVIIQHDIETIKVVSSTFEGMTNGEVIQALFDGLVIDDNSTMRRYAILMTYEFWNAPYKAKR